MGICPSSSNKKNLEEKYDNGDEEQKYEENEMQFRKRPSMSYVPFDSAKQEKMRELFENNIKPSHNTTLTATKLTEWILTYLSEEQYKNDGAIHQDLSDPYYSHLIETMQNELQNDANEPTINAIHTMLKDEIFPYNDDEMDDEYSIDSNSNTANNINNKGRSSVIIHSVDLVAHAANKEASHNIEIAATNDDIMMDTPINLLKQKTLNREEVQVLENAYTANKEPFPEFINVALFGRSDDEYLEMLIDRALTTVCYSNKFKRLWTDITFITNIYSDKHFPSAVETIFNKINHDNDADDLEFIGDFVNTQFKRQINENKRKIEEKAIENIEEQIQENISNDFDGKYDNIYNVYLETDDNGQMQYHIRKKHLGERIDAQKRIRLNAKEDDSLFQIQAQDKAEQKDDFCWAVFKKKTFRNNYGIKTKGKWEIITEAADKKRIKQQKEAKLAEQAQAQLFSSIADQFLHKKKSNDLLKKTKSVMRFVSTRGAAALGLNEMNIDNENEIEEETKSGSLSPTLSKSYNSSDNLHNPATLRNNPFSMQSSANGSMDLLIEGEEQKSEAEIKKKKPKNKKKGPGFKYIPLLHLNLIFELLQYHYWHSIKDKKEKENIARKQELLTSSPLYTDYCALTNFDNRRKTMLRSESEYTININNNIYKLCWWNIKGRSECNALAIHIGEKTDRKYFYLRFRHNYEKIVIIDKGKHVKKEAKKISRMVWDWYDNDAAKYKQYHPGELNAVYKELEATFQANVDSNFPHAIFGNMSDVTAVDEKEKEKDKEKESQRLFDICILPQLKKFLKIYKKLDIECMVLRFTFTDKTNRILNIEQVSLRTTGSFPRNVRRLLDRKNSLNFYWQNTNKFIEEWKHRYLLSTKQQQLYFWSYILCIATIMKYIEIEFNHQVISIPFEMNTMKQDLEYTGLDDSDLQRHKVDYRLWDGFFMPPMNQLQTAQISKNMSVTDNFEDWYASLSRVEPLKKFINSNNTNEKRNILRCGHNNEIKQGNILWYSRQTYDMYCDRCAMRLQFAECIRKYVLEKDSNEVVDFLWPWYRNTFHQCDRKKYLKYIAKYNLSHLFMVRDVLRNSLNKTPEINSESEGVKNTKQIRHLRKFAASVLLGPWDILRNINVIKSELQLLFKSQEEIKNIYVKNWDVWCGLINGINEKAQQQILSSDRTTILELRHGSEFKLNDTEQNILHSLIGSILDQFHANAEVEKVYLSSDDQMRYYTSFKESFSRTPKWWVDEHDILLIELSLKYNWNTHLINKELTDPSKKYYYQELLKKNNTVINVNESSNVDAFSDGVINDDDDEFVENKQEEKKQPQEDFEYRGYQEFQVWCSDWRNMQHRLRVLTFTVCKYLNKCKPSIIEIRIPNISDRPNVYISNSFVFLNGYIEKVHLDNCTTQAIQLNEIVRKNKRIRSMANVLSQKVMDRARESKIIATDLNKSRMRDPFITRHLDFELEQICQSFNLLEIGVDIALFLITILKRKQSESIWNALGIVLEYMPYEKARFVLNEEREDLRHGEPQQLKNVCDKIRRGSNFSVHICLFLSEYMENNAKQDLARFEKWMEFSKYYENEASKTINEIESDHLLSVLIDIPLSESGKQKVPLLQVALEQNRAQFLNNERINAVLKHVWQTPSGLDPNVDIVRKSRSSQQITLLLLNAPYHFYLTPMGFNSTIKSLHLLYLLCIYVFIANRIYLHNTLEKPEMILWTFNIGYFVYEIIEAYDKGLRDYFTLAGWVNYWDLQISFTWLILFAIRILSVVLNYKQFYKDELLYDTNTPSPTHNPDIFVKRWHLAQTYLVLWAIQTASLSARSLVLFQTSEYFGVLLRMMQRLIIEMSKFMFVLFLILVGFVFGLYYIQGGYNDDESLKINTEDWYEGFKYLFQLTVGAGDFAEIENIVENEITAQLFTILYVIFATILMMNLLIALMTTTFENVHSQARTESSFAIAETTFDLSHRSRFMPAPLCIYIFAISAIVHIINFIPALLSPKRLNIYNYINHHRYEYLVDFKISINCLCLCCCKTKRNRNRRDSIYLNDMDLRSDLLTGAEKEKKIKEDVYKLTTRGRVWKYYFSTLFLFETCTPKCISKYLHGYKFNIHHTGCYACIPTKLGAKVRFEDKDRSTCNGITLNQYAEQYEIYHKFSLDPQDTVLLKHLTVDTLFCKYCYRPFDPKNNLDDVLLSPFWALSELISIYLFPFSVWIPLIIVYGTFSLFEKIGSWFDNDEKEPPVVLDHDRQYFQKDTLLINPDNNNNNND